MLRVEGVEIAQVGIEGETAAAAALLTAGDLAKTGAETLTLSTGRQYKCLSISVAGPRCFEPESVLRIRIRGLFDPWILDG